MPRLPKLPGANPVASPDGIAALTQGLVCEEHIDLAAGLSALGHIEAAESVAAQLKDDPLRAVAVLSWMAWCSPERNARDRWTRRARSIWKGAKDGSDGDSRTVSALAGLALLEADPAAKLAAAREAIEPEDENPELARVLLALGKPEEAIALLEEVGGWWCGVGWSTGIMSLQDDGFSHHLIAHLVAGERWDLLGRCARALEDEDELFLGAMSLRIALEGRCDAAQALAAVPAATLRNAFLGVLVSLAPEDRPTLAPLLPRLSPHRRALGEHLLGDPSKADTLMAHEDKDGAIWDRALLAIARDERLELEGLDLHDEHRALRTILGGLRVLSIQGGPPRIAPWIPRFEALARDCHQADEIPSLLADTGRQLSLLGCTAPGQALLGEALRIADGMPKGGDLSWVRNAAIERVGCFAIRGGDVPTALQALRRCTSKSGRATLAPRIAMAYLRAGDAFGAERILTYIQADQHSDRESAIQQVLWDSVPGWRCRWSRDTPPLT